MRIEYHPGVAGDVKEVLHRYEVISHKLRDEFRVELQRAIAAAAANRAGSI